MHAVEQLNGPTALGDAVRLNHHDGVMHLSQRRWILAVTATTTVAVASLVLGACGSSSSVSSGTTTTSIATTTTAPVRLEQPAIWPAADVVFTTPGAAAADFVKTVLRVPPNLGEFQAGDSRSGEMEVFSPDSSGARVTRSLLLLRQLGPDDGWFVLAAINEHETVTTPESASTVAAGPLTVAGAGRGFEATVVVSALGAGDATRHLDQVITMAGAAEAAEPFSVNLDLSRAMPGETVMLLVRGDTGRDEDSGDFSAIPVVISG